MSLNVSGTKYVRVFDPEIKLKVSDKILFANLVTSRKTGNPKVDKSTGEAVLNPETNKEVPERINSRWEGKFVGNAFEAAKGLRQGAAINIINGWATNEPFDGKDGKKHFALVVTITDFELSDIEEGEDEIPTEDE